MKKKEKMKIATSMSSQNIALNFSQPIMPVMPFNPGTAYVVASAHWTYQIQAYKDALGAWHSGYSIDGMSNDPMPTPPLGPSVTTHTGMRSG